jgi:hypothetical protein
MLLSDIYNQLTYGELAHLFITTRKSDETGLTEAAFMKLFPLIQIGLTDIHSRMYMREGHFDLVLVDGVNQYTIDPEQKDLIEIEEIEGILDGNTVTIELDRRDDPSSIRRIAADTILLPPPSDDAKWRVETGVLHLTYRANHPILNNYIANSAPMITPIYLPMTHLYALCLGVASRYMNTVGMKNEFHAGNNYAQKYEVEMARLVKLGFDVQDYGSNNNLSRNDWP